jgi:hypothetical protein
MPECKAHPRAQAAGVRKAPRHEIAGCWAPTVQRALWGFGHGVGVGDVEAMRPIRSLYLEGWASGPGEQADRTLRQKICGAIAGRSGGPTQAGALPAESQQE